MEALGIEPSFRHLCNQLQWDEYTDAMHVTYRNLTLEFLSSLTYEPYVGHTSDGGYINFRLFGTKYTFNHKHFCDLLGFQTAYDASSELPMIYFLSRDVENIWSDITCGGSPDPSTQISNKIHNPTFRYCQMIIAHTFLGKSDPDTRVSAEEIFFMYCTTQSRPVDCGAFLIESLYLNARSAVSPIHVGSTVTHIASALGLDRRLFHLTSYCSYTLMDIDFCLDRGLMRRSSFQPDQYRLLIEGETIHYFTLPDPQVTCVIDQTNWAYAIEGQGETVDEQRVAPTRIKVLTNNPTLKSPSMQSELVKLHMEIAQLRQELVDVALQVEVSVASHDTKIDILNDEITDLRHQIAELRGYEVEETPLYPEH
jgi:hypothetical protein